MDEILQDSRFAHIVKDPRFRRIPKHERKVKIDKRFQSMFKDKRFKVKYTIDKRGRPTNTSSAEDLKRYYDISSSDEVSDSESDEQIVKSKEKLKKTKQKIKRSEENGIKEKAALRKSTYDESDSSPELQGENEDVGSVDGNDELSADVNLSDKIKDKLHDMTVDYARGEGVLLSDSSSDDDSESEGASDDSDDVEHDWGELDKDADTTQEATRRIAICNMDWDRVRAQDLLVLLSSFLPKTGGAVEKVMIYPSEFGLQRMKEEEVKGPLELCENKKANSDEEESTLEDKDEDETEEGRRYHMEKLRRYQLNRLKYFYAIAECDSVATAEHVYNECDGLEYESSATKLDLRFVPDDMTFDQEPRDSCDSLPEPGKYAPKLFTNTALQQAKVELTWDETDPQRVDITRKLQTVKNIDEIDDADLRAYLASSGSDEEERDDQHNAEEDELSSEEEQSKNGDVLSRYKLLVEEAERQEQAKKKRAEDVQMEVTWGLGLKEKTEKLVKERLKSGGSQATPFEEMLAKKREKRRQRREERKKLKQQSHQEENGEAVPFSDDEIPSDIDMSDPYFKEELKDTVPKENKKKKRKRQDGGDDNDDDDEEEKRRKAELELLMLEDGGQESKKHFSLKSIQEAESGSKKKRKKKKLGKKAKKEEQLANTEDDFQVNVNDERFSALFSSHHYNIDPTDPHYKQTKGMEALRKAKLERRHQEDDEEEVKLRQSNTNQKDTTLSQLVKSVKMKTRGLVK
ncbi:ESF1 homolog [Schistocerca americana]|uniref:ESF1 homolog n=1 Tax=Schistocerca americana TaxID=7009 RepID=UPI001F4FA2B1|nr:ESF1 homolog [Schistocerca americana]